MKKALLFIFLLINGFLFAQSNAYEIRVTLKPFRNQYIYLGHYFGKQLPVDDSIKLNDKSEGIFRGTAKLGGGIYLVGYPDKSGFFEMLIDKQQKFSVMADTATLRSEGTKFSNSPDNDLFNAYQKKWLRKEKKLKQQESSWDQQKIQKIQLAGMMN